MGNTVKFDPGLGELFLDFNSLINNIYAQLNKCLSVRQKRILFKLHAQKIYNYLENNTAFYAGCLLWGYYICNENKENPKEIEGNFSRTLSDTQKINYNYMIPINNLNNYFAYFEKDTLYYTGKKITIPDKWKNIMSFYGEFIGLNKGFIDTKTTADIILPEKFKQMTFNQNINEIIQNALKQKDLTLLLKLF